LQTGKVVAIKKIDVGGSKEVSTWLMLQFCSAAGSPKQQSSELQQRFSNLQLLLLLRGPQCARTTTFANVNRTASKPGTYSRQRLPELLPRAVQHSMPDYAAAVLSHYSQGINVTSLREIKLLREIRSPYVVELLDVVAHKRKVNMVRSQPPAMAAAAAAAVEVAMLQQCSAATQVVALVCWAAVKSAWSAGRSPAATLAAAVMQNAASLRNLCHQHTHARAPHWLSCACTCTASLRC
jgi:hypothetical protein